MLWSESPQSLRRLNARNAASKPSLLLWRYPAVTDSTFTPPAGADYFQKLAQFPEYATAAAAAIKSNNDTANAQALQNFQGLCAKWQDNVLNHGVALAGPKPIAPNAIVTMAHVSDDGIWVWEEQGTPVGVCPDPLPTTPSASIVSKPAADRTDLMLALLQQILAKLAKA
jgi:hypothetical protein